jgi:NADP-reducing hydrogenase subunit HndD
MKIFINSQEYDVAPGQTILDACFGIGIEIPTLCYERSIGAIASCRVCVVEVAGRRGLVTSCNTEITEGMQITTNSERVQNARRTVLELLLADHRLNCMECERAADCRLKHAATVARAKSRNFPRDTKMNRIQTDDKYIKRDISKCINCGRCVRMCKNFQKVGVIGTNGRGFNATVSCAYGKGLGTVPCISCGQCVTNCPTGALVEANNLDELTAKLSDPNVHTVVATAPSVRVSIGEGFGLPSGTNAQGKMVAALRRLGFNKVFDLDLGADFTIMEEGAELLNRLRTGENLPQFTSCCPAWINYMEMYHPELIPNISSAKSPMGMFAALVKTYYAEKMGINPKDIYCVMLMPCTAKQMEADRYRSKASTAHEVSREMPCTAKQIEADRHAVKDVDMVITARTVIRLIKESGIDFEHLDDEAYDDPLSMSSGAGLIFGTTGGVAEAAVRTVSELYLGKRMPDESIEFTALRGESGIKTADVDLDGRKLKIAVVSGIANAERVIQEVRAGKLQIDFIEVMACPGGCVNGGGQPSHRGEIQDNRGNARTRAAMLYNMDKYNNLRRSHENPTIKKIYAEFLGSPNGGLAHELLHTHYTAKPKYPH